MKKFLEIILFFSCVGFCFAEKYHVGQSFIPYTPLGLEKITTGNYDSIYPTIAAIRPTSKEDEYEFNVTMLNCDGGNANWAYPVTVTYIVKKGAKIFVKKRGIYSSEEITLVVTEVNNNEIDLITLSDFLKEE